MNKKVCSIADLVVYTDVVDNIDDKLCDNSLPQSQVQLSKEENSS